MPKGSIPPAAAAKESAAGGDGEETRRVPSFDELRAYFPGGELGNSIYALPALGAVYVRNPKAACSTILLWLNRIHTGDPTFSPVNVHTDGRLPTPRAVGWPAVRSMLAGDAYRFTFVRNPLRRLESAYRDKVVNPTEVRWGWRTQVQRLLGLPEDADHIVSFEQFVAAVEQQDPLEMDLHWRPQYLNLMHPLVRYNMLGRVETFDADLRRVKEELDIPDVPVELRNVQPRAESSAYAGRPDLVRRVESLYATDFELYDY